MTDQKTVLVVDDDEDFLTQQQMTLENAGFRVVTASSAREAEKLLETMRPDLAVLDLMMEHHDAGFVLSHRVKKKDPTIPVILVTAVTAETGLQFDAATRDERAWVKADAVLAKPVRTEQLLREVNRLLPR